MCDGADGVVRGLLLLRVFALLYMFVCACMCVGVQGREQGTGASSLSSSSETRVFGVGLGRFFLSLFMFRACNHPLYIYQRIKVSTSHMIQWRRSQPSPSFPFGDLLGSVTLRWASMGCAYCCFSFSFADHHHAPAPSPFLPCRCRKAMSSSLAL